MTKQRYSRSPRMPYAHGGIPRLSPGQTKLSDEQIAAARQRGQVVSFMPDPDDDEPEWCTLGAEMKQLLVELTGVSADVAAADLQWATSMLHPVCAFVACSGLSNYRVWRDFSRHVNRMLLQPSKYDWWESGEITPKLSRLWGLR